MEKTNGESRLEAAHDIAHTLFMAFFERPSRLNQKVQEAFASAGDRRNALDGSKQARNVMDKIVASLTRKYGTEKAEEIAFNLSDWNSDAAFLVALHLYPEKFTQAEIRWGIELLLIHAPNHLMAAATLAGKRLQDIWGLGVVVEPPATQ